MKKLIIYDLDGTLLDVWARYYRVFTSFWGKNLVSLDDFKRLKWSFDDDRQILHHLGLKPDERNYSCYQAFKKQALETLENLMLDTLIADRHIFLLTDFLVVTARRNRENLLWQLDHLGLLKIVEPSLVVVEPVDPESKKRWFNGFASSLKDAEIHIVGDSETDLKMLEVFSEGVSAENIKITAYLVMTGLRDPKKVIARLRLPARVIRDVNEIVEIITRNNFA